MMRVGGALIAMAVLASVASAQTVVESPAVEKAVTPDTIGRRLDAAAERGRRTAPNGAVRGAVVDLAWPKDESEYRALGKYAVVLVSAVSQDASELPLRRVYIRTRWRREIELVKIGSERRELPKYSAAHWVLGPHREDGFYLVPAGLMMRGGVLLADFAAHRRGFKLYELPGSPPDFIQADHRARAVPGAMPDPVALRAMVEREYPGFTPPAGLQ